MASRFAVLGSPIAHSQSPALHRAAIAALGIEATYEAVDVTELTFPEFFGGLSSDWEGLSLTMPLKQTVRPFLVEECSTSTLTGSVNTVVRTPDGWHGFNTDTWGATTAIRQQLGEEFDSAILLGAGATAASLVVSLHDLGVDELTIVVRDVTRADTVRELARRLGINVRIAALGADIPSADILVSSLPASAALSEDVLESLDAGLLFDVVYNPWPSALGREWDARGLPSLSGLSMLLWQAVRQARVFYGDGVDEPLPDEELVITAMRAAVGL